MASLHMTRSIVSFHRWHPNRFVNACTTGAKILWGYCQKKQNAVIATVLSDVFADKQTPKLNFDEKIIAHIDYGIFDAAIGLQMAVSLIEMMNATTRSNMTERLGKDLTKQLFVELNGLYTDNGVATAIGLQKRLVREISQLRIYFFPKPKSIIITPIIN